MDSIEPNDNDITLPDINSKLYFSIEIYFIESDRDLTVKREDNIISGSYSRNPNINCRKTKESHNNSMV